MRAGCRKWETVGSEPCSLAQARDRCGLFFAIRSTAQLPGAAQRPSSAHALLHPWLGPQSWPDMWWLAVGAACRPPRGSPSSCCSSCWRGSSQQARGRRTGELAQAGLGGAAATARRQRQRLPPAHPNAPSSPSRRAAGRRLKLVGGRAARDGSRYAYLARIHFLLDDDRGLLAGCGGTLVSPRVVLTAAHCTALAKEGGKNVYVRIGAFNPLTDEAFREVRQLSVEGGTEGGRRAGSGGSVLAAAQLDASLPLPHRATTSCGAWTRWCPTRTTCKEQRTSPPRPTTWPSSSSTSRCRAASPPSSCRRVSKSGRERGVLR